MAPDRWVVLDDTDTTRITYTGTWFQDSGSQDNVGIFGTPYLHTLHGTSVDGSVEFEFNGTAVEVWGTNIVKDANTNPDPTFECFVDNIGISRDKPFGAGENNYRFCGQDHLPDGHHKLRIDVKVVSHDQTFWLDQLRYIPSPGAPLDNQVILFNNTDPAIQFDSHWTDFGNIVNATLENNSVAKVSFIGTSVIWVGFVPTELSHTGATGSWAVDGGEGTKFLLPGLPATGTSSLYNQIHFMTPEIEAGPHTLTVTFLGNNQTTPLCLDYLYVKNGTFPVSTSTSNKTTSPNPKGKDGTLPRGSHTGAIVGGVVGGLALLAIIAGTILVFRCRRPRLRGRFILAEESGYSPTPPDLHRDRDPSTVTQVGHHQSPAIPSTFVSETILRVPSPQEGQQSRAVRKQFEALGRASISRFQNETEQAALTDGINSASSSWSQVGTTEACAMHQHMDSGIRLSEQPIVDVPPQYTPR